MSAAPGITVDPASAVPKSPCRLCATEASFAFDVRGQRLYRCGDCGYLQVAPVPSDAELAEIYGGQYFEKSKYRNDEAQAREQDRRAALLVQAGIKPGANVFDFGCAAGSFLATIQDRYEAYGADVSPEAIAMAQAQLPALRDRLRVAPLSDPVPADLPMMDAIVAWDVIEHLGDPVGVIGKLARKLKPGGVLAISTPDAGAPLARLMKRRWAFMTPPEHLGFFDAATTGRLFGGAGVTLETTMSRGKWANAAFLAYKLRRVFPEWLPERWVASFGQSAAGRLCLYVPTGDVLYATGRKRHAEDH